MDMYVGLTDYNWYCNLKDMKPDEVNFWRPSSQPFCAIPKNGMFVFKLKKPYYAIVGGGFFVNYSLMPLDLAWDTFHRKNGVSNYENFVNTIVKYKNGNASNPTNSSLNYVGCITLTEPFFFDEPLWIDPPKDWSSNLVSGKKYDSTSGEGKRIYEAIRLRLSGSKMTGVELTKEILNDSSQPRYTRSLAKHRIGQAGFRILVTEAYGRQCAVSGEKTLPVLQAAHIQAFSENGPNEVQNGILLRSDIHTLYDKGYITITPDLDIEVSKRLHDDFGNGKMYYAYHGKQLSVIPKDIRSAPAKEYLEWHNEKIYLG